MTQFQQRYHVGQVVSLRNKQGEEVTVGGVVEYCNSVPHQWHLMVQEPGTEDVLPAAIWERAEGRGTFGVHIAQEHREAYRLGEPVHYTPQDLEARVRLIGDQVTQIVPIGSSSQSQEYSQTARRGKNQRLISAGLGAVGLGLGFVASRILRRRSQA